MRAQIRPKSMPVIALLVLALLVAVRRCPTGDRDREPPSASAVGECRVARLADGDSLTCVGGARVRLLGIDAPELAQPPFGRRSEEALRDLIGDTPLRLEYDVDVHDRFGRLLAYAWAGPVLVNERLVRDGWAVAYGGPPNDRHGARLRAAEAAARRDGAGHWSSGGFACLPVDHRQGRC